MAGKLHEVLAVESDLENVYKKVLDETLKAFRSGAMFTAAVRTYQPFEDKPENQLPVERQAMATTVPQRLRYTFEHFARFINAVAVKECTNQLAVADVVIDGVVIIEAAPATLLLGLESKLRILRDLYTKIPTLPVNIRWEKSPEHGEDVYRMQHPDKTIRSAKTFKHRVLYEATEQHPAQIEKWEEQGPIGEYVKEVWSGMVSSAEKSKFLGRIDKLIRAVKQARQRAKAAVGMIIRIATPNFRVMVRYDLAPTVPSTAG